MPEPRHHEQMASRVVVRCFPKTGKRDPDHRLLLIHPFPGGGQMEFRRQNPDDRVGDITQTDGFSDSCRITMEPLLEVCVGQNRDSVVTWSLLFGAQQSSNWRLQAEQRKQVRGGET